RGTSDGDRITGELLVRPVPPASAEPHTVVAGRTWRGITGRVLRADRYPQGRRRQAKCLRIEDTIGLEIEAEGHRDRGGGAARALGRRRDAGAVLGDLPRGCICSISCSRAMPENAARDGFAHGVERAWIPEAALAIGVGEIIDLEE